MKRWKICACVRVREIRVWDITRHIYKERNVDCARILSTVLAITGKMTTTNRGGKNYGERTKGSGKGEWRETKIPGIMKNSIGAFNSSSRRYVTRCHELVQVRKKTMEEELREGSYPSIIWLRNDATPILIRRETNDRKKKKKHTKVRKEICTSSSAWCFIIMIIRYTNF